MSAIAASAPLITFPEGLVGQPDWKQFVLVTPTEDVPVKLLQSIDNEKLALMVTDPVRLVTDYAMQLSDDDSEVLGLSPDERPVVLTTISIYGDQITTNLAGPLVINTRTRQGKQVVLVDSAYSTRHPVATLAEQGS